MITRKLLLVFGLFFFLNATENMMAQQGPTNPIILNEYCVTNVPSGYPDEKGVLNDYVEIYNNHTQALDLKGFYLSNDRLNLLKWKFPANFPQLQVANYTLVWLSGKNTNDGVNFHTNFTIEQCKNQWIIISNASGVVYDSIFVQPTKAGHVRGRVDVNNIGVGAWRIFNTKSPKYANGTPTASSYAPTPKIFVATSTNFTANPNPGGFFADGAQIAYFRLQNQTYDETNSCYDIFYTLNGDYPVPFYPGLVSTDGFCFKYVDSTTTITLAKTTIVRAVAVLNPTSVVCPTDVLPSFCETNTYFIDPEHNAFDPNFGVISIALDKADTSWFNSQGTPATSIHVEYYDSKTQVSEGYAMINRPPQEEWRTAQKGFYITKDDRLGFGCNFEGPIFNVEGLGTTPRKVFPTLHLKGGDYESHSLIAGSTGTAATVSFGTGIRDVVMQSLAAKYNLNVNPLHIKPVVAFVNGNYWGVYDLREVYDKYYEQFYDNQSPDSLDLDFVHSCQEGFISYWDGPVPQFGANFNSSVYNVVKVGPMNAPNIYNKVISQLDKGSFIDYMILNSYGMNSDLWCNNVSLAKGAQAGKSGGKWHFYLWNMPSAFNYTAVAPTGLSFNSSAVSPCFLYNSINANYSYTPTLNAFNAQGNIMTTLMNSLKGNSSFQLEYKNRYQDLLNGPLKCENIEKHFDYVYNLYRKEMLYHEDPASTPSAGKFATTVGMWDTNTAVLRKVIALRCFYFESAFTKPGCYGAAGPFALTVDVEPSGAGKVKLNSTILDNYIWYGSYYQTQMSFKAIPTSTNYVFHHWQFNGPTPSSSVALSMDSVSLNFNTGGAVVAVFTDKQNDIANSGSGANIPTGFTPNGDGLNDDFRPLGSGEYASEYQMTIFNRWGQEVFRSVDPLNGWDGRYKGQEALTGVYAYFITYKNIYNESKLLKGNVTLTR
jgi:gliding motility-associated-like protein